MNGNLMIGFKDSNKSLYHYTKVSTAIDGVLKNRVLKIGRLINTNDPKETKNWEFNLGTNENRSLSSYNMKELSKELSTELKAKTKVICFSKDTDPLTGDHLKDIYNRGFCKPRMWAQYADNHKGVCLIFEKDKLDKLIHETFGSSCAILKGDVAYINRGVIPRFDEGDYVINIDYFEQRGLKEYAKAHRDQFYKRLFFEKMIDWKDEAEFRWVLFSDTDEDLLLDFKDSLKGICFGENTTEENIDAILEMTKDMDVDYVGIKWKNCSPWYDVNFKYDKNMRNSPWAKLKRK